MLWRRSGFRTRLLRGTILLLLRETVLLLHRAILPLPALWIGSVCICRANARGRMSAAPRTKVLWARCGSFATAVDGLRPSSLGWPSPIDIGKLGTIALGLLHDLALGG